MMCMPRPGALEQDINFYLVSMWSKVSWSDILENNLANLLDFISKSFLSGLI